MAAVANIGEWLAHHGTSHRARPAPALSKMRATRASARTSTSPASGTCPTLADSLSRWMGANKPPPQLFARFIRSRVIAIKFQLAKDSIRIWRTRREQSSQKARRRPAQKLCITPTPNPTRCAPAEIGRCHCGTTGKSKRGKALVRQARRFGVQRGALREVVRIAEANKVSIVRIRSIALRVGLDVDRPHQRQHRSAR